MQKQRSGHTTSQIAIPAEGGSLYIAVLLLDALHFGPRRFSSMILCALRSEGGWVQKHFRKMCFTDSTLNAGESSPP